MRGLNVTPTHKMTCDTHASPVLTVFYWIVTDPRWKGKRRGTLRAFVANPDPAIMGIHTVCLVAFVLPFCVRYRSEFACRVSITGLHLASMYDISSKDVIFNLPQVPSAWTA